MTDTSSQKILTISIPTWNRGVLVKVLLENIITEISKYQLESKVEVQITNNASSDDTEAIILCYAQKHDYIFYTNNGVNIGLGPNVLKCMYLAKGKYCLLLGDDDRLKTGSLPALIEYLEQHPDTGLLIDTSIHKKYKVEKEVTMELAPFLEKYYYFMGNAGVFIVRSSYVQENYEKRNMKGISFSWPQTQLIILSSYQHPEYKIRLNNFNLFGESEHANITLYNSFYLWKVAYFELMEDMENMKGLVSAEVVQAAKKYYADNAVQNLFNILQCGVFLDDHAIKSKTQKHILEHLNPFSFKEKVYLFIIVAVLRLPSAVSKFLSNVFIFLIRGREGLEKKNKFVKQELEKKEIINSKKKTIIREFSFEGATV